jgi:signal peptidase I
MDEAMEKTPLQDLTVPNAVLCDLMQSALARGTPFRFRGLGYSMSPFIREGDTVFVSPLLGQKLRVGQVVAFIQSKSGLLLIHRVVCHKGSHILVQGDNMHRRDADRVSLENILGCVTQVKRNGQSVWFGQGAIGYWISLFSRLELLTPIVSVLRGLFSRKAAPG